MSPASDRRSGDHRPPPPDTAKAEAPGPADPSSSTEPATGADTTSATDPEATENQASPTPAESGPVVSTPEAPAAGETPDAQAPSGSNPYDALVKRAEKARADALPPAVAPEAPADTDSTPGS